MQLGLLRISLILCLLFPGMGGAEETQDQWVTRLLHEQEANLILIKYKTSRASGFACRYRGQDTLVTNAHVMAGMLNPEFIRLKGGASVIPGSAAAAVGHDIVCMGLPPIAKPLEVLPHLDGEVAIGDEILVLGNTGGADVILPLHGKVVAIGPNLIEISAEIQSGNSGSPIIHRKTGNVIGVVSFLLAPDEKLPGEMVASKKERRFGYRLDTVVQWQKINWDAFQREADRCARIAELTEDLAHVIDVLSRGDASNPTLQNNPAIAPAAQRLLLTLNSPTAKRGDRIIAARNFIDDIQATCRMDIKAAKASMQFDYFRREIEQEEPTRELMAKTLQRVSDTMTGMR